MGLRLELGVKSHLGFEVAATGPLSTREGTACPDVLGGCQATTERLGFTLLTGALGAHADVGRFRPFVSLGGGRMWVKDRDPSAVWLLGGGADWRVAGPFNLGFDYRASRIRWSFEETGVNQELSLRVTIDVLGAG